MNTSRILIVALAALGFTITGAQAQIYLEYSPETPGEPSVAIGEYNFDGTAINPILAAPSSEAALSISGSNLYTTQTNGLDTYTTTINEYDTSGATLNSAVIPNLYSYQIAGVGSDIYIAVGDANGFEGNSGGIAEYTTSGQVVSRNLIPLGTDDVASALAVSGNDIYVAYFDNQTSQERIGEYTTLGATVNASLISNLSFSPVSMAISAGNIYLSNWGEAAADQGSISEYTTSGQLVTDSLVTGLTLPHNIAVSGDNLYITTQDPTTGVGGVLQYTTTGTLVNASLISGISGAFGLVIGNTAAPVTPTTSTSTLTSGQSYTDVTPVTSTGGLNTTTSLVGGTAGSNETVTLSTTNLATQFKSLASDVVSVSGNAGNVFAVQLTFDLNAANEIGGADAVRLLWLNPSTGLWTNAVNGNTPIDGHGNVTDPAMLDFDGSFADFELTFNITNANLSNYLGAYGVDTANDTAWAVIDHNSDFTVANVNAPPTAVTPEPSTWALLLGGAGFLAFWRRRAQRS